jgi:molybdopterin molybdotransferase
VVPAGHAGLLPVEDAVARVIGGVDPLSAEIVPLNEALGRTLAATLAARRTQPPFPASAMDGYAVRASDAREGASLTVIGISVAGKRFAGAIGPGETARIFTGAPVPDGADAVLIQENAEAGEGSIRVLAAVTAGRNIRPAGLDFSEGDVLLRPGRTFAAREIALAAAMGHAEVPVRRRPMVAIVSTGDELVPPGAVAGPDQIVASNGPAVAAYVWGLGGDARDLGIVRDDSGALGDAVERALATDADILVTLGGASVGDHDLVGKVLAEKGMKLDFWRIAMRPGKPLIYGAIPRNDGLPLRVLGLPGNPVSSFVCAVVFLRPLIGAMLGQPPSDATEPAILGTDVPANDTRQDYVRAKLTRGAGLPIATPLPLQDSSMLSTLAEADCLLIRAPGAPAAKAGDPCRIIRLG